jgi:hypothetical protein
MSELDDLMQEAQEKLEQQEQEQKEQEYQEDIYADFRDDGTPLESSYPNPEIKYEETVPTHKEVDISYRPDSFEDDYLIDNGNITVFPGGPTLAQVDVWKKQFTNEKVFHTKILEKDFIFRTLNRYEYKQIVAIENVDSLYREEVICRTCVLFPFNYEFMTMAKEDSRNTSTLAQIIMENSGFTKEYGIEVL